MAQLAPILAGVSDRLRARRGAAAPFIVGVTGAVASGKSTFSGQLAQAIGGWPEAGAVEIVCTDGFLKTNAALEAEGLSMRKGFPESFDAKAMAGALSAIRAGAADFPGYSHVTYDVDPALTRRLSSPDVLIVEGLGLHDGPAANGLDALVYLDADEAHLEAWFTQRLLGLMAAGVTDEASFYHRFRHFGPDQARDFCVSVWQSINLPNLRGHIVLARDHADIVVRKGPQHQIEAITEAPART
ncbi:MAG: hypothetical protein ACHP7N_15030 [Caulobacterales bacterium]